MSACLIRLPHDYVALVGVDTEMKGSSGGVLIRRPPPLHCHGLRAQKRRDARFQRKSVLLVIGTC